MKRFKKSRVEVIEKPLGTRASRPQSLGNAGKMPAYPGKTGGFAITSVALIFLFLIFFTTCVNRPKQGADVTLAGTWLPEEVGSVPGNFPDKLELFKDGNGVSNGRNVTWTGKNGTLVIYDISGALFVYYYEATTSKLILTDGGGSGRSVIYIAIEETYAKTYEEQVMKKKQAIAEQTWKEAGASFLTNMVFVEGGSFTMGCTPEQTNDCFDNEKPMRWVTLSDFYIGKFEVTQMQWIAVMGNNPSHFEGSNLPVENVSWDDVQEFIKILNEKTGENYRLPTEAEWEYSARGGNLSMGYNYSGSDTVEDVAWYRGNSISSTHPVGTSMANELGIHDMSGNVSEWVSDGYKNYNDDRPVYDSAGDMVRVHRGGAWPAEAIYSRVSYRGRGEAWFRTFTYGFRLAHSSN